MHKIIMMMLLYAFRYQTGFNGILQISGKFVKDSFVDHSIPEGEKDA